MIAIDSVDWTVIRSRLGHMKLSGVDANLLPALDALLRERNVTRAARRLGVGQPAVSHSLARLRSHFRDELLVLRGRTYFLTAKGEKLAEVVASATRAMAAVFEEPPDFDPASSSSRFVVACSDLLGFVIIPELLRTLQSEAEHVEVELRTPITWSKESPLEAGVDLALGIFEDVPPSMNQASICEGRWPVSCAKTTAGLGTASRSKPTATFPIWRLPPLRVRYPSSTSNGRWRP